MTDPIADMLTRIRNAVKVGKAEVVVPYSRVKFEIAKILEQEGYLQGVEKHSGKLSPVPELKCAVAYGAKKDSSIHVIRRLSTPGRRLYGGYRELPRAGSGAGLAIVSTPQGIMTSRQARKLKLGGEIICEVY